MWKRPPCGQLSSPDRWVRIRRASGGRQHPRSRCCLPIGCALNGMVACLSDRGCLPRRSLPRKCCARWSARRQRAPRPKGGAPSSTAPSRSSASCTAVWRWPWAVRHTRTLLVIISASSRARSTSAGPSSPEGAQATPSRASPTWGSCTSGARSSWPLSRRAPASPSAAAQPLRSLLLGQGSRHLTRSMLRASLPCGSYRTIPPGADLGGGQRTTSCSRCLRRLGRVTCTRLRPSSSHALSN